MVIKLSEFVRTDGQAVTVFTVCKYKYKMDNECMGECEENKKKRKNPFLGLFYFTDCLIRKV